MITEVFETDHSLEKDVFDAQEPQLRGALIDAQFNLLESENRAVVVLSGMDSLGRSEVAKQLIGWMDSRRMRLHAAFQPSDEETERPRMWKFWRSMPATGHIGLFLNSWYDRPMLDFFMGHIDENEFNRQMAAIVDFETMLALQGTIFQKFMLVLPHEEHARDFKKKLKKGKVPWKTSDEANEINIEFLDRYDHGMEVLNELVKQTSPTISPWTVIASMDKHHRDMSIGRKLVDTMCDNSEIDRLREQGAAAFVAPPQPSENILGGLDLQLDISPGDYKSELKKEQQKLTKLTLSKAFEKRALVAVFEGNDAAGKGGSIRRVVQALDPRMMRSVSVSAPSDEERAQSYLWRFWRYIPRRGNITIYDRSWYGRVLVERIESYASDHAWSRAYDEINAFEKELNDFGIIVVKFWLSIDRDEQYRRFKERERVKYKRHKITEEDWRNRDKWEDYRAAVHDMVARTSTKWAPWTLVEANSKHYARIKVVRTIADRLQAELSD